MGQNRELRNEPTFIRSINLWQAGKNINREKTVSQTKDVMKTGQLHVKESNCTACGCGKKWNPNALLVGI